MNKVTKIVVILMITTIIIYTVIGVQRTHEIEQNSAQSGDVLNDNNISGDNQFDILYEITSGDNEVALRGISEGSISTTRYKFENEKLVNIILEEQITSGDNGLIENVFNYMKNDTEMSMVYSTIEMQGNTITAVLKDEYVDAYGDASKVDVYEQLVKLLEAENN